MGALLVEDLGDGAPGVLGTGAFGGAGAAPLIDLSVEVVEVTEAPGGEEALAHEADEPFHAALLIAARRRDRTRLEVVVRGELKHRGMEPDGVGAPFEHDASHVVVEDFSHTASQGVERLDMAAQEVGERGVEVEPNEGITRVAEHQDKRHQGAFGTSDRDLAEVRPVDLLCRVVGNAECPAQPMESRGYPSGFTRH